ncbi:hypothetical protein LguiA_025745 [Lonicera macranthoides]
MAMELLRNQSESKSLEERVLGQRCCMSKSSPLRAKLALEIVKPPPPSSAVSSFAASDAPPPPIHLPFLPLQPPFFLYSRRRTSADAPSPPISLPLPFLQVYDVSQYLLKKIPSKNERKRRAEEELRRNGQMEIGKSPKKKSCP